MSYDVNTVFIYTGNFPYLTKPITHTWFTDKIIYKKKHHIFVGISEAKHISGNSPFHKIFCISTD